MFGAVFGLHLNSGIQTLPFLVKTFFFFFDLHLICFSEKKIVVEVYTTSLKIGQNCKLFPPPNAQQRSASLFACLFHNSIIIRARGFHFRNSLRACSALPCSLANFLRFKKF